MTDHHIHVDINNTKIGRLEELDSGKHKQDPIFKYIC